MDSTPASGLQASWILRVGVAMEFVGHGALGLGRVAAWASYFAVFGVPRDTALAVMPWVGGLDVALGIAVLLYPARALVLYLAAWGLGTALLRPLAGESLWEAVERAGNFGAAAALFLMAAGPGAGSWFRRPKGGALPARGRAQVCWTLRLTTAALLLGHGLLGLSVHKAMLGTQYAVLGLRSPRFESSVGAFECLLAGAVLVRPGFGLLLFAVAWKLATEALAPLSGTPWWVFVEHGGSYAAPLALAVLLREREAPATLPQGASPAPP
jgi:hypothetical protein